MKKSFCFMKIVSALFALALFASCDSGGGGGGGGSNSAAQNSKTKITITIPKATSSSSDINLLGDFKPEETDSFYYEIYFENSSFKSEHKFAGPEKQVTFDNVKYDTYDFYLKIWVDNRMKQELKTINITKTVSATDSTVTFDDMKTSYYKEWFFVSTAENLETVVNSIRGNSEYSESNRAKICLLRDIEKPSWEELLNTIDGKYELLKNGCTIAEKLFSVNIDTAIVGGTVTASSTKAPFGAEITLTVTANEPPEKYKFKSLTIGSVGLVYELSADNTYTFNMPENDVTVTADFIRVYTITYELDDGRNSEDNPSEYTAEQVLDAPITLADAAKEGYLFYGWYENEDFSGSKVTEISSGTTEDKIFHARWVDTIYVKNGGNPSNDGLSEGKAVDTLATALSKIESIGSNFRLEGFKWKIKVIGTIIGPQTFSASSVYGTDSIEIEGILGTIDGNNSDSALTIDVTPPVTIKNLTIKNGKGVDTSSDDTRTGGGMTISANSNVTIESGVVIESNTADSYGGGILNRGILTINGGEIKNNTADTHGGGIFNYSNAIVYIYGNTSISGNSLIGTGPTDWKYGGGIYNSQNGKVYLGYKSSNEKEAWTGSIYSNSANCGGGIWNAANAQLYFDSGSISSNTTNSTSSASVELMGNSESNCALYLGGSATITDIYLADYGSNNKVATISVEEKITNTISLTIDTDGYKADTQILIGVAVGTSYTNFSLTNVGLYKIDNTGTLVNKDVNDFTNADIDYLAVNNSFTSKDFNDLTNKTKLILYKGEGANAGDGTVYPYYGVIKIVTDASSTSTIWFNGNDTSFNLDWNDTAFIYWNLKTKAMMGSFADEHYDVLSFSFSYLGITFGSSSGTTSLKIYEIDL